MKRKHVGNGNGNGTSEAMRAELFSTTAQDVLDQLTLEQRGPLEVAAILVALSIDYIEGRTLQAWQLGRLIKPGAERHVPSWWGFNRNDGEKPKIR